MAFLNAQKCRASLQTFIDRCLAEVSSCNYEVIFGSRRLQPALAQVENLCHHLIPKTNQKTIICHSERSEESLFLSRRDSSLCCAPFRMT
jgi:hypothetical protein